MTANQNSEPLKMAKMAYSEIGSKVNFTQILISNLGFRVSNFVFEFIFFLVLPKSSSYLLKLEVAMRSRLKRLPNPELSWPQFHMTFCLVVGGSLWTCLAEFLSTMSDLNQDQSYQNWEDFPSKKRNSVEKWNVCETLKPSIWHYLNWIVIVIILLFKLLRYIFQQLYYWSLVT